MIALLIVAGIIGWIFLGLGMLIWMINRSVDICGGDNEKIRFGQIFAAENLWEPYFWGMIALSLIWWAVLIVVVGAWRCHARKIREMAKYD